MTPAEVVPALALLAVFTRELLWLTAIAIAVSGIDDLAVDLLWLAGVACRPRLKLPPPPAVPGHFAILVPAWDESAVIGDMLRRLISTVEHPAFTVFVGIYPNDPETARAVAAVEDPRIVPAFVTRPGPTTKADCLNALWRGALAREEVLGTRFKAIVLHDAEDVLHPLSLQVHDRWMPRLAMVQLPVVPFVDADSRWVSGHYLDEFAENHAKDMEVRALLRAPVPSAGVGTAIDRDMLERIAGPGGAPFDATSLTEDYELGHKIHALGGAARLVNHWHRSELIATREYFPATMDTAVRQKSRWLAGIALSGWDRLGWGGGFSRRWMLLRDRKGPLTAAITMAAYGAAALSLAQIMVRYTLETPDGLPLPPFLGPGGPWLAVLLALNAGLLAWRLFMRAWFTGQRHGWQEGLRAIPRALVANLINFLAARRAAERYAAVVGGAPARWGKTAHRFPAAETPELAVTKSG